MILGTTFEFAANCPTNSSIALPWFFSHGTFLFSVCATVNETNHSFDPSVVKTRSFSTGIIAALISSSFSISSFIFSFFSSFFSLNTSFFSLIFRWASNQDSRSLSVASAGRISDAGLTSSFSFSSSSSSDSCDSSSGSGAVFSEDLEVEDLSDVFSDTLEVGSSEELLVFSFPSATNLANACALSSAFSASVFDPRVSSRSFSSLNSSSGSMCSDFASAFAFSFSSASSSGSTCAAAIALARSSSSVDRPTVSPKRRVNMSCDLSEVATVGCFAFSISASFAFSVSLFSWGVIWPVGWVSDDLLEDDLDSTLVTDFLAAGFSVASAFLADGSSSWPTSASHHECLLDLCEDLVCFVACAAVCFEPSWNTLAGATAVPCTMPDPARPAMAMTATSEPATAKRAKEPRVGLDPRSFSGTRSDCFSAPLEVATISAVGMR